MRLQAFKIDEKRIRLPLVVNVVCPNCRREVPLDLTANGLDYPDIGKATRVYGECDDCDHELDASIVIEVQVELAPGTEGSLTHRKLRR